MKERRLLGPRLLVLSLTSGGRRNYDDFTNGSLASASWTDITYNGCKSGNIRMSVLTRMGTDVYKNELSFSRQISLNILE